MNNTIHNRINRALKTERITIHNRIIMTNINNIDLNEIYNKTEVSFGKIEIVRIDGKENHSEKMHKRNRQALEKRKNNKFFFNCVGFSFSKGSAKLFKFGGIHMVNIQNEKTFKKNIRIIFSVLESLGHEPKIIEIKDIKIPQFKNNIMINLEKEYETHMGKMELERQRLEYSSRKSFNGTVEYYIDCEIFEEDDINIECEIFDGKIFLSSNDINIDIQPNMIDILNLIKTMTAEDQKEIKNSISGMLCKERFVCEKINTINKINKINKIDQTSLWGC